MISRCLSSIAFNEAIVVRSTSVGNQSSIFTVTVEDNTIRTRLSTSINIEGWEDRVLVPRAGHGEVEPLVVVVLVRVAMVGLAGLQKGVSLVQGGIDIWLPVACFATAFNARVAFVRRDSSVDAGEEEKSGGGDLWYNQVSISIIWIRSLYLGRVQQSVVWLRYSSLTYLGVLHLCELCTKVTV